MELLRPGDEIDLMDENDVYCPAIIIAIKPLKINYIGWGTNWDETIKNKDEYRIQYPAGKYVKKCKVWVKYHKDICHWPSILYLRLPKEGSKLGIEYLKHEPKVYVKPLGTLSLLETIKNLKSYSSGAWINTSYVWPFHSSLKKRWIENGMIPKYQSVFQEALNTLENSDYLDINFKFHGSYDTLQKKRKNNDNNNNNNNSYDNNNNNSHNNNNNGNDNNIISSNSTPSQLASHKLNEIRKKSFDVLSSNLYPVLENKPPKLKSIDKINEGLIKFYLSTKPTSNYNQQSQSQSQSQQNFTTFINSTIPTSNSNSNNNNNNNNNNNTISIKNLFNPSSFSEHIFTKSPKLATVTVITRNSNLTSGRQKDLELERETEDMVITNSETNSNSSDKKRKGNQPQKYEVKRKRA